jgi:hypothetical protein
VQAAAESRNRLELQMVVAFHLVVVALLEACLLVEAHHVAEVAKQARIPDVYQVGDHAFLAVAFRVDPNREEVVP